MLDLVCLLDILKMDQSKHYFEQNKLEVTIPTTSLV